MNSRAEGVTRTLPSNDRRRHRSPLGWGQLAMGIVALAYFVSVAASSLGCPQLLWNARNATYLVTGLAAGLLLAYSGYRGSQAGERLIYGSQLAAGLVAGYLALPSLGAIVTALVFATSARVIARNKGRRIGTILALTVGFVVGATLTYGNLFSAADAVRCP